MFEPACSQLCTLKTTITMQIHSFCMCFLFFYAVPVADSGTFTTSNENDVSLGKKLYEDFSDKVAVYGDCWQKAVLDLHNGCSKLTEESQSRLALSFANCFLKNSGSKTCFCPSDKPIPECLRDADERIFSTYREFFTHTKSICYFLQQKNWQLRTENTILKLSENSDKVSRQLENSSKAQTEMLSLQQVALKKQQQLINSSEKGLQNLNSELERSRNNARSLYEEFRTTTEEQRFVMFTVFEQIKKLEALVLGRFAGVYTFMYYFLAVVLSYLLTSTRRTESARILLMLLFSANAVLERLVTSSSIAEESGSQIFLNDDGPIFHRLWLCRNTCCVIAVIILIVVSYRYKDYNVINNQLLIEIQKQNSEMQNFIRSLSSSNAPENNRRENLYKPSDVSKTPVSVSKTGNAESLSSSNAGRPNRIPHSHKTAAAVSSDDKAETTNRLKENSFGVLHSTPDVKLATTSTKQKPKEKISDLPISPVVTTESIETSSFEGSRESSVMSTSEKRYNLRDRSRLSSPRSFSTYVFMAAEMSEKNRKTIKNRLKKQ